MSIYSLRIANRNRGQLHPKAQLSDLEVEQVRRLREDDGWSYGRIAEVFEISKSQVASICKYRTR